MENIDLKMLARSGLMAGTFAYFIANATQKEATWLACEMHARFQSQITKSVQDFTTKAMSQDTSSSQITLDSCLAYQADRYRESLYTILRLSADAKNIVESLIKDMYVFVDNTRHRIREAINISSPRMDTSGYDLTLYQKVCSIVPHRLYKGPIMSKAVFDALPDPLRWEWGQIATNLSKKQRLSLRLAEYWVDGQRSILDIVDLVEMECGIRNPALTLNFFEILEALGLVVLKRNPEPVEH